MSDHVRRRIDAFGSIRRVDNGRTSARSGVRCSRSRIGSTSATSPTTPRTPTRSSLRSSRCSLPEGAPNVLVVLLDDVGFGAASAFGGPANTPTAERLQRDGLSYNRFHTTALCAPTRAALLSGRNHHSVGMGMITETATAAPGSSGVRPNTKAALAMTLKLNGYSTAQFGKCHEVPPWQSSPVGPFDAWPSGGGGFEHFYGFIGGENNQYYPALYDGFAPIEPEKSPEEGYHLTEDLADRAIDWVRTQKALAPGQAVLHVLRTRSDPRAPPCAGRMGRQVRREVRRRLGRAARSDVRSAAGDRRGARATPRSHPARRRSPHGRTCPTSSNRCSNVRWRSTRASWSTPTSTSGG